MDHSYIFILAVSVNQVLEYAPIQSVLSVVMTIQSVFSVVVTLSLLYIFTVHEETNYVLVLHDSHIVTSA